MELEEYVYCYRLCDACDRSPARLHLVRKRLQKLAAQAMARYN